MKAFKIITTAKGYEIKIDPEEVVKVFNARRSGNDVLLKQGMFNPSHYVLLVEDKDREMVKETDDNGHYTGKVMPKPLEDIFAGIEYISQLKSADVKRLN